MIRMGDWMHSLKGNRIYPTDLHPEDIDIEEIAHALSMLCRFGGHCREFYSVAQHSAIVSTLCPENLRLVGLLHDAAEAYCGDIVRPLKMSLPGYQEIEDRAWRAIASRFHLPAILPMEVVVEDARVLLTEKRDLLAPSEHEWLFPQCAFPDIVPDDSIIKPLPPGESRELFMDLFQEYAALRGAAGAA